MAKVSPYFPRAPAKCEKVSTAFFNCFSTRGKELRGDGDVTTNENAGNDALTECAKELKAYNACVDRVLGKNQPKLYRVPEAYRSVSKE